MLIHRLIDRQIYRKTHDRDMDIIGQLNVHGIAGVVCPLHCGEGWMLALWSSFSVRRGSGLFQKPVFRFWIGFDSRCWRFDHEKYRNTIEQWRFVDDRNPNVWSKSESIPQIRLDKLASSNSVNSGPSWNFENQWSVHCPLLFLWTPKQVVEGVWNPFDYVWQCLLADRCFFWDSRSFQ